jgi:hypothetical protein
MMSFSVTSEALDRFNDTDLAVAEASSTGNSCKTIMPNAVLVGALVLSGLSLLVLGGWAVLLWIRRVEKRSEKQDVDGHGEMIDKVKEVKEV